MSKVKSNLIVSGTVTADTPTDPTHLATKDYVDTSVPPNDLPTGGTTGQVLGKVSATNYDVNWIDQISGAPQTYTPVLTAVTTNPTLGTGAVTEGRYIVLGSLVFVHIKLVFGTGATAGSGNYRISLPIGARVSTAAVTTIGSGRGSDASASTSRVFTPYTASTFDGGTTFQMLYSSSDIATVVTNSFPWTWTTSDYISIFLTYEMA